MNVAKYRDLMWMQPGLKVYDFLFFFSSQAPPNHILPSLYLMDSMMKNLGGDYLELFGKGIVAWFCRSFEKLVGLNNPVSNCR